MLPTWWPMQMVNVRLQRKRRSNRYYVTSQHCPHLRQKLMPSVPRSQVSLTPILKLVVVVALREIEDVKHDTREAEDVLDVAVAIAEADGEIEPEERKVLEEIAGVLGLRLENHL